MNAREATQAKLQQLLNRAPPLPGRGIIINNEDNYTPISLNSHIDMYKYVMDHDEKSSQRLVDQFKILKPPPKLISPKAEIIYARKSRCNSPSILTRRIEKNTMHSTPIQKTSPWKGQSRSFKKSNQDDEGDDQGVINDTRPASASKVSGLSWHLQLDQERFVERRKSFDIAEKISKEKQEAYEAYLNQRLQKASKGSNDAFLDLVKRNEEWRQQCRNRRKQAKEKYAEEWINRRKEFRDKLAEHINKPLPKIDRSWREIEDEQELQRLERVERRMNELRISSASPLVSRPNSNGTFVVDRVGGIGSMRVYRSTSRPVSRSRNRGKFILHTIET